MRHKLRLWPAVLILAAWVGSLLWVSRSEDLVQQQRNLTSAGFTLVALVLLSLWFVGLSRLPGKLRWGGMGLMVVLLAALVGLFRVRGVTGDLVPVLEWRFPSSPTPEAVGTAAGGGPLDGVADYPQFLGPRRDGSLPGPALDRDWEASPPRLVWKRPVGTGWAGFSVAGGTAYTLEQFGEEEVLTAYELATGRLRWKHSDPARYDTVIAGPGPRSVPTVSGDQVCAMGAIGHLRCLDRHSGELLWSHDVLAELGARNLEWGRSTSPLIVGEAVIVGGGGPGGPTLVAYDRASGRELWRGGEDAVSYSSPRLVELAGRRQIIQLNQTSLTGQDPDDGAVLWRIPWPGGQPNVSVPVVLPEDRLFASSGYGVGGKMLRLSEQEGKLQPELLWESPRLKAKFTNVVFHQGYLYGLDDGVLVCLDPVDGERCWKRGRYGHGQVILVGNLLLVQGEDGEVLLIDPNPEELRELGSMQALEGKTWNPPALAGRYLLVRNDREAALYELPLAGS